MRPLWVCFKLRIQQEYFDSFKLFSLLSWWWFYSTWLRPLFQLVDGTLHLADGVIICNYCYNPTIFFLPTCRLFVLARNSEKLMIGWHCVASFPLFLVCGGHDVHGLAETMYEAVEFVKGCPVVQACLTPSIPIRTRSRTFLIPICRVRGFVPLIPRPVSSHSCRQAA